MMFMVLLMTAMGCSLTACSDDDDDNGGSSQDAIDDKTAFENVEMYNILNALQAIPYIEQRRLAPWTHNKTIQKAIESYRITPEQKEHLRMLKIK